MDCQIFRNHDHRGIVCIVTLEPHYRTIITDNEEFKHLYFPKSKMSICLREHIYYIYYGLEIAPNVICSHNLWHSLEISCGDWKNTFETRNIQESTPDNIIIDYVKEIATAILNSSFNDPGDEIKHNIGYTYDTVKRTYVKLDKKDVDNYEAMFNNGYNTSEHVKLRVAIKFNDLEYIKRNFKYAENDIKLNCLYNSISYSRFDIAKYIFNNVRYPASYYNKCIALLSSVNLVQALDYFPKSELKKIAFDRLLHKINSTTSLFHIVYKKYKKHVHSREIHQEYLKNKGS